MSLKFDEKSSGDRMMALLEQWSPLQRMLNSKGLDRTFEIMRSELPETRVHEYPSGSEVGTWIIPEQWAVLSGTMTDSAGTVIASTDECILFVAAYSEAVDGWFTKDEISSHLRTRPDMPHAFALEHRNAYNFEINSWGISLPHDRWNELPEGNYHIQIRVELTPGSMKVGEIILSGEREEIINISAHIDELCNDDLAGCVVAVEVIRWLSTLPHRTYTYQLTLAPELIGTVAYLHHNPEVVDRTLCTINLEAVGAGAEWLFKKSLKPDTRIDHALRLALGLSSTSFKEVGFFEAYGNDERVYAWSGTDIPGVALQRFPFPEYHTSDDVPGIVSQAHLHQALQIVQKTVEILEMDYVPSYLGTLPPWLSRHSLYFDAADEADKYHKFNNLLLFSIDGQRSVQDLAVEIGIDFNEAVDYLNKFVNAGLIERAPVSWK